LAIVLQPKFPVPKARDKIYSQKDDDGVIDIGWCDGVLSDGRPFRAETWAQDLVTMITIFFSNIGLKELDNKALFKLVEDEGLVTFVDDEPKRLSALKWTNNDGNEFWSVNIAVGAEEQTFLSNSVPVFPYSTAGEPNTMFNRTPIKIAHLAGTKGQKA
jgi:hypothetical protein